MGGRPARGARRRLSAAGRPFLVPYAVAFGPLTAGVVPHLGWLLRSGDPELDRFLAVPALLAVATVAGAALVWAASVAAGGWSRRATRPAVGTRGTRRAR